MKISVGTVQFGINYGVANKTGQVAISEIEHIITLCRDHGIDTLDTAAAYGDSEKRLGDVGVTDFKIITKLPIFDSSREDPKSWVENQVNDSLERLQVPGVHGFLFHNPDQLMSTTGESLYKSLLAHKESGLLQKIGVSIYSPEQLMQLDKNFEFDLVQAPFNIVDRRMLESGCFSTLKLNQVEIHVRSVFLQGLLLMPAVERHSYFQAWPKFWKIWDEWLSVSEISPLQVCLGFVFTVPEIDRIVIGVDSASQLEQIILSIPSESCDYPSNLSMDDKLLIEPFRWPRFCR